MLELINHNMDDFLTSKQESNQMLFSKRTRWRELSSTQAIHEIIVIL